ncbi:GntR family transcriptional regulator [Enterococcus faecalis]
MLDNTNKLPLYVQLVNTLLEQIQNDMSPNDKPPTEKEICEEYSVSRTTVRLTMNELENRGYIYRIQGKGSFVSSIKKNTINSFFDLDFRAHYEGMNSEELTSELIFFKKEAAQLSLRQKMGLQQEHNIIKIQVLRKLLDIPVALETIILKNQYFNFINEAKLKEEGVDKLINTIDIPLKIVEEKYKARRLNPDEIDLLQSKDEAALVVTKSLYNTNNELIIISERKILTSKLSYQNFIQKEN